MIRVLWTPTAIAWALVYEGMQVDLIEVVVVVVALVVLYFPRRLLHRLWAAWARRFRAPPRYPRVRTLRVNRVGKLVPASRWMTFDRFFSR